MPAQKILKDKKNIKWQPRYDSENLAGAWVNAGDQILFYAVPQGQADAGGAVKTTFETNVVTAGIMPNREAFDAIALSIYFWDTQHLTITEIRALYENVRATVTFNIRETQYLQLPVQRFGAGWSLSGFLSDDGNAAPVARDQWVQGTGDPRSIYSFVPHPVFVPELTPFDITVRFQSAPPGFLTGRDTRMFVSLEGTTFIPVYK